MEAAAKANGLAGNFYQRQATVKAEIGVPKGNFFFQSNFTLDIGSAKSLILFAPFVKAFSLREFYKPALPYQVTGQGIGGLSKVTWCAFQISSWVTS